MLALLAQPELYRNLLLASPATDGLSGISTEKIERFCKDRFLITYEIPKKETVDAVRGGRQVTTVGTNCSYRNLMGYPILNGSFFTKAAWDAGQKHAVLNETAAYDIFGSINLSGQTLKIGGEPWLVVGVMQDGDLENTRIYVPSSVAGGVADSLLALVDADGGKTEAYAKNALKELDVSETNYQIVNLSDIASMYWERFTLAWETVVCILILIFMRYQAVSLKSSLRFYKDRLRQRYLRELFAENRTAFLKSAGSASLLITSVAAILCILRQILTVCLKWQSLPPESILFGKGGFDAKTAYFKEYDLIDSALFFLLLILLVLISFLYWNYLSQNKGKQVRQEMKSKSSA